MEELIVAVIILCAAGYTVYRFARKPTCGCGSGCACKQSPDKTNHSQHQHGQCGHSDCQCGK